MDDIFISHNELKKDLGEIEKIGQTLAQRLALLEQNMKYIFSQIKLCITLEQAQEYFEILDDIQSMLALLVYRENIGVPDRLWRFMTDFDNFEEAKNYYFERIKNGEYAF
jgi:hypothetical protein